MFDVFTPPLFLLFFPLLFFTQVNFYNMIIIAIVTLIAINFFNLWLSNNPVNEPEFCPFIQILCLFN